MSDNVFEAGAASANANPDQGLPNVMDLVSRMTTELQKDPAGWILAGVVPGLATIALTIGGIVLIYGGMFLGMAPGMAADDEDLMVLGMFGGLGLGTFVLVAGMMLVITPMWASLYRAVWANLTRGEKMTLMAPVSTITQDLGSQFAYSFVAALIVMVGLSFCYLPGIIAQGMLMFAWPAVVIHRVPIGRAISYSFGHAMAHPGWHLGLWAVGLVMSLVLPYIPIIGYMLLFTVHTLFVCLAYLAVAGDGDSPRDLPV